LMSLLTEVSIISVEWGKNCVQKKNTNLRVYNKSRNLLDERPNLIN